MKIYYVATGKSEYIVPATVSVTHQSFCNYHQTSDVNTHNNYEEEVITKHEDLTKWYTPPRS